MHPADAPAPPHVFTPIEEMLLPADHPAVVAEFKEFDKVLKASGMDSALVPPPDVVKDRRAPLVAWKCGRGSFGCMWATREWCQR